MTTDHDLADSLEARLRSLGAALDDAAPPIEIGGEAFGRRSDDGERDPATISPLRIESAAGSKRRVNHVSSGTFRTRPSTFVAAAVVLVAAGTVFGLGSLRDRTATVDVASSAPPPQTEAQTASIDRLDIGTVAGSGAVNAAPAAVDGFRRALDASAGAVPGKEPVNGEPQAVLTIPSLDLSVVVVEGVGREELKIGPGLYPTTAFPGTLGNAAIAGHRTTYGAPFHDLDQLEVGDELEVETAQGVFRYAVLAQADGASYRIVEPDEVDILDATDRALLTLTTNHPKYSARQRLIVQAELVSEPVPTRWPDRASRLTPIGPG